MVLSDRTVAVDFFGRQWMLHAARHCTTTCIFITAVVTSLIKEMGLDPINNNQ